MFNITKKINFIPKKSILKYNAIHNDLNEYKKRPCYFDYQATTPIDPRVLDAMMPYLTAHFGNPHSNTHLYGRECKSAMEKARKQIATLIGADPEDIYFTSGATESNNISIKGVGNGLSDQNNHIITTTIEHDCVLKCAQDLQQKGLQITFMPVQKNGVIDIRNLEKTITKKTSLISAMAVNNEIGVIQPLKSIGALCKSRKILFHTDAAQAIGKIPIDVVDYNIDLMSLSGHKIYGPKGIGAVYVNGKSKIKVEALFSGGGQEGGLRSGTVPAPLAIGFGEACEIAGREMLYDHQWVKTLSECLLTTLQSELPLVVRNGDPVQSYPGCLNLSFEYVNAVILLIALNEVALSTGSACSSTSIEQSHVLKAIGLDQDISMSCVRFGLGRFTTEEEVHQIINKCIHAVKGLRNLNPEWKKRQK